MMVIMKCNDGREHSRVEDEDAGEIFCSKCGMVLDEKIAIVKEGSREFERHQSTHAPQIGTSTVISQDNKLVGRNREGAHALRKWDSRIRATSQKVIVVHTIDSATEKLGIPSHAVKEIKDMVSKLAKQKLTRGRTYTEIIAGCIVAVCRRDGITKSMSDVADILNISSKRVFRMYRMIKDVFEIDAKVSSPSDYMSRIASVVGIQQDVLRHAQRYMTKLMTLEFQTGRSPIVVAATILYLTSRAYGLGITQKSIARAAGVTDISMRNTQKKMITSQLELFTQIASRK